MAVVAEPAEAAIKAKIEEMDKLVNGWVFASAGIGDRAGDRTQRAGEAALAGS